MSLLRVMALLAFAATANAQSLNFDAPQAKNKVTYLAEPINVEAGKPSDIELDFHIADAIHINSHTPFASELIPTTLTLVSTPEIKLGKMQYPIATKYAFSFAPNEKLSVYSGNITIKIRVIVAHSGRFTWNGSLRYQACDNAQCYPPKNLPVTVLITAK